MKGLAALILGFVIAAPFARAGQEPDERVSLGTTEITVDVVVRDDKGRPVRDLTAADFRVAEDGVSQQITSFRYVSPDLEPPAGVPGDVVTNNRLDPDSPAAIGAVALVFDRLSPDARVRARQAAASFVDEALLGGDLVGVYALDLTMSVAQPFTDDKKLVQTAIERVAGQASASFSTNREVARNLMARQETLERETSRTRNLTGQAAQEASSDVGALSTEAAANEMTLRSIEALEVLERDQQGFSTSNGLLAVVAALARIPGRKAIVFFSEGIAIPSSVQQYFRAVVGNANRANVSVYTVDAAGLRAVSAVSETAQEMTAAGRRRIEQIASGRDDSGGPLMRSAERSEDLMRLDPETGLGELAKATGGFLISGTNDPGSRLRLVGEDLHSHYVLTYVPKDTTFDGAFRRIAVEVSRPKVAVQARDGYYAIDAAGQITVLAHEAPALAMLVSGRAKPSFPLGIASLSFPERERPGLSHVLVEVPLREMTCTVGADKKSFTTDFTVVAVLRDPDRRIVEKLSQRYQLGGPVERMKELQAGNALFFRELTLEPGDYSVDAIVYDAASKKASSVSGALSVPDAAGLRMSSVVVVGRADKLSEAERKSSNPLHVGDVLIYPDFAGTVSKSRQGKLAFFTTIYAAPGGAAPTMQIELRQNGRALGQLPAELPAPDGSGRIQFVNALPLDIFQPGSYELRLIAADGKSTVSRRTPFTVVP